MICFNWLNALRYLWPRGPPLGLSVCGLLQQLRLDFFLSSPPSTPPFSSPASLWPSSFLARSTPFPSIYVFLSAKSPCPSPLRPWPLRLSRNRTIVHSDRRERAKSWFSSWRAENRGRFINIPLRQVDLYYHGWFMHDFAVLFDFDSAACHWRIFALRNVSFRCFAFGRVRNFGGSDDRQNSNDEV